MEIKINNSLNAKSLIAMMLFLSFLFSCSNSENDKNSSVVDFEISEVTNITESSAVINVLLNSSGMRKYHFEESALAKK
jgi:hypothetical protein